MLLEATEMGLNGLCIGAFDRQRLREALDLPLEPLLVVAIGKSIEHIEPVEVDAAAPLTYYRQEGVHYVPKIRPDELIIQ